MKIGMRKPSIKKSISARTTGRAKRAVKKLSPVMGKRAWAGLQILKKPPITRYTGKLHLAD